MCDCHALPCAGEQRRLPNQTSYQLDWEKLQYNIYLTTAPKTLIHSSWNGSSEACLLYLHCVQLIVVLRISLLDTLLSRGDWSIDCSRAGLTAIHTVSVCTSHFTVGWRKPIIITERFFRSVLKICASHNWTTRLRSPSLNVGGDIIACVFISYPRASFTFHIIHYLFVCNISYHSFSVFCSIILTFLHTRTPHTLKYIQTYIHTYIHTSIYTNRYPHIFGVSQQLHFDSE